jgi:outer membrane protein TolC
MDAVVALAEATDLLEEEDPLLIDLICEAEENNPDLRAAREMEAEARARPSQAGSLPDPMLFFPYVNEGWEPNLGQNEFTMLGVVWTQDLPYPGKRDLRNRVLTFEANQAAQQIQRARLSLAAAVRRAYHGVVHARALLTLIDERERNLHLIADLARERYAAGFGVQQDALRAQVEVVRIGQARAEQTAENTMRLAELNRLTARAYDAPLETPAHFELRPLRQTLEQLLAAAVAVSPELRNARISVERDRAGVELARKASKPDFNVMGGYQNRGGLDGMWQVGFGLRLPIFSSRNESGVAESQARLRASESRVEMVELLLRQRTQERAAQAQAAEETIRLYEEGIIPQDRMTLEAALSSYQAGRVPFIAALEAQATLYADREAWLALLFVHEHLRASLAEASLEPTPDMPASGAMPARTGPMGR